MSTIKRILLRASVCAAAAVAFTASPAAAAPGPFRTESAAFCPLMPGVYGIIDSTGQLVGILIIYTDCTMEIIRKQTT